jgi:hypothetical protein
LKICKNFYQNLLDLNLTIILQIRCNKTGGVCRILASPLLFGSPCGNSTHVLEVNYICIKSKKNNLIFMNQLKLLLLS